jgi:hypothetical protein
MTDVSLSPSARGSRTWRVATSALVIAAPSLVTCALLFALFRATLLDHFPVLSDEIAYQHQIAAFVRAGFAGGYFNFDEHPAPFAATHFSAHGPGFPLIYGLLGRVLGWHVYSGPIFNLLLLALATTVFLLMNPLPRARIVATGIVVMTSWWVLIMAPVTMQESLHQSVMVVMAAVAARLLHPDTRRHGALLFGALVILAVSSVLRPTNWIVAVPLVVIALARRPLYATIAAIIAGLGVPAFWLLWRYLSAPIPSLAIEFTEVTGLHGSAIVLQHFLTRVPSNIASIFDFKAFPRSAIRSACDVRERRARRRVCGAGVDRRRQDGRAPERNGIQGRPLQRAHSRRGAGRVSWLLLRRRCEHQSCHGAVPALVAARARGDRMPHLAPCDSDRCASTGCTVVPHEVPRLAGDALYVQPRAC